MKSGNGASDSQSSTSARKRASTIAAEDQAGSKRSRVSRACDQCRASREKCDGTQPACQTCLAQRRDCSYIEQPKKRGIQPNYIRTLEMTLAWLLSRQSCEVDLATKLASPDDHVLRKLAGRDLPGAEALHQAWRNGIVCRQIDQILSGSTVEHPDTGRSPEARAVAAHASHMARTEFQDQMALSVRTPKGSARAYDADGVADLQHSPLLSNFASQPDPQLMAHPSNPLLSSIVSRQQLPANAWTLLEYYFAFTLAWLPISDKQEMLKLMYAFPAHGLSHTELAQSAGYAELFSIMALASRQMGAMAEAEILRRLSMSLVPSVQGHFKAGNEQWAAAWLLIGTAIRLLLVMSSNASQDESRSTAVGLSSQADLPPILRVFPSCAKLASVMLAAFVLESTIAVKLRLTPHLGPYATGPVSKLQEDGLEEWATWSDPLSQVPHAKAPTRANSTFNTLLRLTRSGFLDSGRLRNDQSSFTESAPQGPLSTPITFDRTVVMLLQNAALANGRKHPRDVVAACEAGIAGIEVPCPPSAPAIVQQPGYFGFMSVPTNDGTETAFDASDVEVDAGNANAAWPQDATQIPQQLPTFAYIDDAAPGADLFEELAMLERTDTSQHPQFLRNLGFAPDLDLAEFFGADYQPSDPFLASMQPSFFGELPSSAADGRADAG
ncbi:hypothetical protein LTR53_008019 [Teratosphaeriaceae sp. CCFEE 6253]|nr:hypothetical protein LTR53_008019 [Teratosphaeriaceae sp. CCFEE 6253]